MDSCSVKASNSKFAKCVIGKRVEAARLLALVHDERVKLGTVSSGISCVESQNPTDELRDHYAQLGIVRH
jgi:hypothetical protein